MPDTDDFTLDPDLLESDRTLGRVPIYGEEPGRQQGKPTAAVLAPCPRCGRQVLTGQTASLELVTLEPAVPTYVLVWDRGAPWPRLAQSRGYVAHACEKTNNKEDNAHG